MTIYLLEIAGYALAVFGIGKAFDKFQRYRRGRKQLNLDYSSQDHKYEDGRESRIAMARH